MPESSRTTVFALSERETFDLGRSLAQRLRGGELLILEGQLGMGKTVFARGIAVGLGVAGEDVSSPSFSLIHEHSGGRLMLYHVDLYRIEDPAELPTLGLEEILAADAVVLVEWGERLPEFYRRDAITIRFHEIGEDSRRIEMLAAHEERADSPPQDA